MAATRERQLPSANRPKMERRPRANFETWSWYFMRISGLILIFMALIHFAITHIIYDVTDTNATFVQARWSNPLWRAYDWTLLALGLFHGINGLRWIIDDYVKSSRGRATIKAVLYSVTFFLFAYGTLTILTFKS
ncbi:MAG TPA: succinate dehydrogenase hydrophobic membrane anchor subunit [Acidimicrobiales bacterium]|nr:succinate dehydrogenase hydrophobic membrane anchor subunit [Acidimicrobiales bacterium]